MHFSSLIEVVSATVLSRYVQGPFEERSGMFFIAPAGHLKTTAIEILDEFDRTLMVTNLTNKTLNAMRQDAISGQINVIGFADWEMIYRRHGSVSAQIEGSIMSLAGEGYRNPSFTDQRVTAIPARCTVLGCMTTKFYERMYENWNDSGFLRRFLFPQYRLANPEQLEDSILKWKKAELDGNFILKTPTNRSIPYNLEEKETEVIRHSLRFVKYDKKIPLILAQKVFCVLKWKFQRSDPKRPLFIWKDFAESLGKNGAILELGKT